jgi:hypothetical protein
MTKSSTVQNLFRLFRQFRFTINHNNNNIVMIGRWNLDYNDTIQNRKVYWANMDHCGCCDQKNVTDKVTHDDFEEYILLYVM